jgi:hypothetical protein
MTEDQLQASIFQYHWNNYPQERGLLFHVNNKARNKIEGNKFKAMGVIPGVSDLIYLNPGGKPILIELKTENGTQSLEQKKWELQVRASGYQYVICRSLEDFLISIAH